MDDEEDDFISFGTPLPEIEDESTLRKKAAKELQVRDEKGRQRFHGAFTGGFSAGYFNTVGTKEGWAPSTFVSTRSKTAERIQQNPEDFMDDEDFGEFGIATRKIHTTSNFQDVTEGTRKRKHFTADQVIPGEAPLKDIVQPVRESIGYEILKKLGWRQGQGIGPREKKQPLGTKVYGCSPFTDAVVSEEDDPLAMAYTFAPKDTEVMLYQPKDNYFGIGYTGLSKESIFAARNDPFAPTSTKSWLAKDKKKLTISGQAFGVGAYEDDDEDIYGKDDMSQYDFSDFAGGGSKDSPRTPESKRHGTFESILEGFCLASQPPLVKKQYPAPTIPPDFKPIHMKSVSDVAKNANLIVPRHALAASGRSVLLGEKKFQKLSPDDKKRENVSVVQPQTSQSTPAASVKYRPFPNDIDKQKRYEEFLKVKQGRDIKSIQPSSMTEWERQQEIEEFAKASVRFKPVPNAFLNSHFESGAQLSVEHEIMLALKKIKNEKPELPAVEKKKVGSSSREIFEWHPVSLLCKRMNVPNPYPSSSSSGTQSMSKVKSVFAHLSSTSEKPRSHEDTSISEITSSNNSKSKMLETSKNMPNETPLSMQASGVSISGNKENPSSENEKPSIDFFKDIFENSSSDEEDSSKGDEQSKAPDNPIKNSEMEAYLQSEESLHETHFLSSHDSNNSESREKNSQEHTEKTTSIQNSHKKLGFGVFANLDLDALNQRKSTDKLLSQKNIVSKTSERETVTANTSCDEPTTEQPKSNEVYGPDLPPNFSSNHPPVCSTYKVESRKQHKCKSIHKHKHHKHKSKKKKKKKSSKRDSDKSDSSSDGFDDIPPEFILEKLKKLQKKN